MAILRRISRLFRTCWLLPWLALAASGEPLARGLHFGKPQKLALPAGQVDCVVRPEGAWFLSRTGQLSRLASPQSRPVSLEVGKGGQHLSIGRQQLAVSFADEVRCFTLAGKPAQRLPCPQAGPSLWSDLDGDGQDDLAVVSGDQLRIFVQGRAYQLAVGRLPLALAAADADGDGRPDLAVACAGEGEVRVWRNLGKLAFQAERPRPTPYPAALAWVDLNGDGKPDLISADRASGQLQLGERSLDLKTPLTDLEVADLNGDGRPDLVLAAPLQGLVYLLGPDFEPKTLECSPPEWGASWGGSLLAGGPQAAERIPAEPAPLRAALGFDSKSLLKLENQTLLALNDSSAALLGAGLDYRGVKLAVGLDRRVLTAELNGDGRPDLLLGGPTWSLRLNRGGGVFGEAEELPYKGYHGLAVDLNGNGRDEIVVFPEKAAQMVVLSD